MAINFPDSPILNEEFTISGRTWIWTGDYWKSKTSSISGDSLPAQSGHAGEFLTTDGTTASWTTVNVSATTVSDTPPTSPIEGDAWFKSSTGQFFIYYDGFWIEIVAFSGIDPAEIYQAIADGDIATLASANGYTDSAIAAIPPVDLTGYATETYVDSAVSGLVASAPAALDTLNELAAALGDDPNFATTITNSIATKAPSVNPTFSGTVVLPDTTSIGGISPNELGYLDGATSNLQGQIDTKAPTASPTFTGNSTFGGVIYGSSSIYSNGTTTSSGFQSTEGSMMVGGTIYSTRSGNIVLGVSRMTSDGSAINFYRGSTTVVGSVSVTTTSTAYNTSSDYRLKENVVPLGNACDRVKALNPVRFNFIAEPGKTVDGFLAHEAAEVVPEVVTGEKDAVDENGDPIYQGIDQSKLVPLLTAALQDSIARVESLEAQIDNLTQRLSALEGN